MIYRQAHLKRENTHQVVWMDCEKKWEKGSRVRLKDQTHWWDVVSVGASAMEKKEINTSRTWDAGGLNRI